MSKELSPSLDWQRVLVVAIVILIGVEFILGAFMVNVLLYNVRNSSGDFTGVKVIAEPYTSWSVTYTVKNESNITVGNGVCGASGSWACPTTCSSGYSIHAYLYSDDYNAIFTLQILVRGEIRNSTTGTHYFSASAVC